MNKLLSFGILISSFLTSQALAQDGTAKSVVTNAKIVKSELRENGYWGIYEELPNIDLQKSDIWLRSEPKTLEIALLRVRANNKFIPILQLSQSIVFSGGLAPPRAYPKLSEARFMAALELGEIKSANRLLSNFDFDKSGEDIKIKYIDNLFYELRTEDACSTVETIKPLKPNKRLLEMRAACYALNNEKSAALLNIDIANQIGSSPNIWLNNAIIYLTALKSGNVPANSIEFSGETGMAFAISNAANLGPKDDSFSRSAFRAANAIALKKEALSFNEAIAATVFGARKSNSIPDAKMPPPPVLSDTEIMPDPLPTPSFEEIAALTLKKANDISEFSVIANKFQDKFQELRIVSIEDAPMFAAAAILSGNYDEAERLLKIGADNPSLKFALQIAKGTKSIEAKSRLSGIEIGSKEYFKAFGELLLASKMGVEIENFSPIEVNLPPSNDGQNQILMAMEDAANDGARAQTALLAHLASQNLRPATIDSISLSRIIGALNKTGFSNEAKSLLIYCIIAQNITFAPPKPASPPPSVPKLKDEVKPKSIPKDQKPKPTNGNNSSKAPETAKKPVIPAKATPKTEPKPVAPKTAPKPEPSKEKPKSEIPDWRKTID